MNPRHVPMILFTSPNLRVLFATPIFAWSCLEASSPSLQSIAKLFGGAIQPVPRFQGRRKEATTTDTSSSASNAGPGIAAATMDAGSNATGPCVCLIFCCMTPRLTISAIIRRYAAHRFIKGGIILLFCQLAIPCVVFVTSPSHSDQ